VTLYGYRPHIAPLCCVFLLLCSVHRLICLLHQCTSLASTSFILADLALAAFMNGDADTGADMQMIPINVEVPVDLGLHPHSSFSGTRATDCRQQDHKLVASQSASVRLHSVLSRAETSTGLIT
jgi:hypothetical protein